MTSATGVTRRLGHEQINCLVVGDRTSQTSILAPSARSGYARRRKKVSTMRRRHRAVRERTQTRTSAHVQPHLFERRFILINCVDMHAKRES